MDPNSKWPTCRECRHWDTRFGNGMGSHRCIRFPPMTGRFAMTQAHESCHLCDPIETEADKIMKKHLLNQEPACYRRPLGKTNLEPRVVRALVAAEIKTVGALTRKTPADIVATRGVGPNGFVAIAKMLFDLELSIGCELMNNEEDR